MLYFSERHGSLTSSHTSEPTSTTTEMHQAFPCRPPAGVPGQAMADTGCRTAVGGWFWHESFQVPGGAQEEEHRLVGCGGA